MKPLPDPWDELAYQLEHGPRPARADPMAGPWEVNASLFEQLAQLPPAERHAERQRLARFQHSIDAARLAGWPTYGLPVGPVPTSLDTWQQVRRLPPSKHLSEPRKARQRDRYKRAMADALDTFARQHLPRRTIPRRHEAVLRPRWLDHRHDCRSGRCPGCATITVPTPPRWRRRWRSRPRDLLAGHTVSVVEWLLDRASAMRACRDAIALRDRTCGGTMVIPQSCRVRTCPDCEAARQSRVVERYTAAVEALDADRARFLTLTIANRPRGELAAGLAALQDGTERLKRRALWRGGRCRPGPCRQCGQRRLGHATDHEWAPTCRQPADPQRPGWQLPHEPVTACMTSTEVTYNRDRRSWHPHAHLLIEAPYLDQGELADTWRQLTGDSYIVWIASVRRHATDKWAGDVQGALRELLKYAAKPSPAFLSGEDPAPIAELLVALRGRHLTTTAGKLYDLATDDLDEAEPEPLVLVWGDDPAADPFRAPATCPLHGGLADWVVAGHVPRHEARRVAARAGPRRAVLTMLE